MGFEAFEALDAASDHADPEIASRARYLLRLMRVEWIASDDPPEVKQCLEHYELVDAEGRELRMRALARLPDGLGIHALCRLVRFEKSPPLSKAAATAFLARVKAEPPKPEEVKAIRQKLQKCKRPAAVWLLAWTRLTDKADARMAKWSKFIEDEHAVLQRDPKESSPQVVSGLIRFQVEWLTRLGRSEEAAEVVRRLVQLEKGEPESLAELLDWLIERKAWRAVDDLFGRFSPQFAVNSELLYMCAEAYAAQGDKNRADQYADRASKLNPGNQTGQLYKHVQTAFFLRNRGLFDWARREFEHAIEHSGQEAGLTVIACMYLAEMLHDRNENLEAAGVLQKLVQKIDAGKVDMAKLHNDNPKELRSQMHYFFACHWEASQDAAKQRAALEKALEADPENIDALIAAHRLPEKSKEFGEKVAGEIEKLSRQFQELIDENPENAVGYNQYAWLAGNTGGDLDKALKYSLKSLELEPEQGGYYDTLAHVYFAKGDYENAVKSQTKAVELDPHSGVIRRKLDLFRAKLKETKER